MLLPQNKKPIVCAETKQPVLTLRTAIVSSIAHTSNFFAHHVYALRITTLRVFDIYTTYTLVLVILYMQA